MASDKKAFVAAAASLGLPTTGTKKDIATRITQFGYNAAADKGRRQAPQTRVSHEGVILTDKKRKKVQATAQDQNRNHALVAWMVRNHIDYVSSFHVSFRTGNEPLDNLVNRIFRWHGSPANFDVAKRLGRDEMFRLYEMEKVISGDAGLIKLANLKLQGLESDLIAKGQNSPKLVNAHGLIVDKSTGEREKFAVCDRGDNGKSCVFNHLEDASNVIFDGYWSRLTSQYRGVSPLTTAINMVQDIHEAFEFNLIKAKVHALFGVAITRNPGGDDGFGGVGGATAETEEADATATQVERDLNPRAISVLDLNPGEEATAIESKSPSTEFVDGSYLFIQVAMLALDLPITFFDSRRSSFSARIADLNAYEKASEWKRTKNRYVRKEYSDWLLGEIWTTQEDKWGLRKAAEKAGFTGLREVQEQLEWIPSGSPWLDKLKQVKGDDLAIELRLDNALDAARRRGADVFKNIDKQLMVEAYEREERVRLGLPERVSGDPAKYDAEAMIDDTDKENQK